MPNTYTLLETITVGAAGASTVTFNSIPQTGYTDLVVKVSCRSNASGGGGGGVWDAAFVKFNGSSTSFSNRYLFGAGSGAPLSGIGSTTSIDFWTDYSGATASTFGSTEIYIPNYTSSNFKSVSVDTVAENNGTASFNGFNAGLWSNTAAITSIALTLGTGSWVQHSTFSLYGVSALGVTPTKAPKATGGDIIMTDGTYWIHTFLSSGTFKPATALTCDYLVVAGGGGGASNFGGGGGSGGFRSTVTATGGGGSLESALSLASGTAYTVTIGAGGPTATQGSNSVFSTITSTGGGLGATLAGNGGSGGSGGGASSTTVAQTGGTGTANQGYAGGNATGAGAPFFGAGGGGGAGAVGGAYAGSSASGNGGAGVATSISGSSVTYAGGGGGGGYTPYSITAGTGGSGGGGNGATPAAAAGVAGTANTGSGGGGGAGDSGVGGAGGSGIVIVRYLA